MDWALLLSALIAVESGGNRGVIGDIHTRYPAVGVLQIRQPCLTDVNRIAGTNFKLVDVRKNPSIARWACVTYIRHYGKVYTRKTGHTLTYDVAAKIWNGGPNGWKKGSTEAYWNKVARKLP